MEAYHLGDAMTYSNQTNTKLTFALQTRNGAAMAPMVPSAMGCYELLGETRIVKVEMFGMSLSVGCQ